MGGPFGQLTRLRGNVPWMARKQGASNAELHVTGADPVPVLGKAVNEAEKSRLSGEAVCGPCLRRASPGVPIFYETHDYAGRFFCPPCGSSIFTRSADEIDVNL
ncbi:hypothetical protein [Cypionkella psychrotolerans]|uniref:hypothetical protein n=1 Tax=Cypionkella psychrotolerans TaxID=1678131 RepID=UPI001F3A9937|nr:hypothetical protein [Cypionkella psychrotolerans]